MSYPVTKAAKWAVSELRGVVVSAGLMQKTVRVRVGGQKYNPRIQKMFTTPKSYLVHDPNSSLHTGDVVSIVPGWPTSKHKRHVVKQIIAPFGVPMEERHPVPTEEERIALRDKWKAEKDTRREARKRATGGANATTIVASRS
ncbi:nucleic acid-binding protein [Sodiomyces alkalinus F11]|uniref:Nucleic acid-binding protein n=1 Tax=Sodiomyces alkalinus (strain CBS 110278 / VKM F-3762 / F11) TaxID=1314773 RepID=A0A3N2Q7T9_SODAK|nr:nucleic acid-binding protein [Sodiomyces alkalinus F11]ROT42695.1 nucleic acid-binding protein [Sodiomyces alkalinus F11]